jgi:hypothetical protein
LAIITVDLKEESGEWSVKRGRSNISKALMGFLDCSEELIVTDGLEEEVEGTDLVTLKGVFLKGCGEDDVHMIYTETILDFDGGSQHLIVSQDENGNVAFRLK